jgi:hypothetical protein
MFICSQVRLLHGTRVAMPGLWSHDHGQSNIQLMC